MFSNFILDRRSVDELGVGKLLEIFKLEVAQHMYNSQHLTTEIVYKRL